MDKRLTKRVPCYRYRLPGSSIHRVTVLILSNALTSRKQGVLHADVACSTAWDDKLGGATGYGAALLAQWAILEGEGQP